MLVVTIAVPAQKTGTLLWLSVVAVAISSCCATKIQFTGTLLPDLFSDLIFFVNMRHPYQK
jgi:hypothetical protein